MKRTNSRRPGRPRRPGSLREPQTPRESTEQKPNGEKPRKEVNAMNYEKPKIVELPSACAAVQKLTKAMSFNDSAHEPSVTAYEADE